MSEEHQLIKDVYAAKENTEKADDLIRKYIPFIRAAAAKHMSGICTDQDDEYSIAMMAFLMRQLWAIKGKRIIS